MLSPRLPLIYRLALASILVGAPLSFLNSCGPTASSDSSSARVDSAEVALDATEKSLIDALNTHRRQSGKSALKLSSMLSQLAHTESAGAAAMPQVGKKSTEQVRRLSGFNSVSVSNGVLKDRGAQTGASFIEYWKKDSAETLSDDWSHVGVGVSKSADGRLFTVMILGGSQFATGASLMSPALMP